MKIITPTLVIELSQMCNLDCKHCLNGESRNVFINEEKIKKIFDEIAGVRKLFFTGGEVFLAYEQMKMVLEIAAKKKVCILKCEMLTNGTIYDERIYDLLNEYFQDNFSIGISNDDYHDKSIERVYKKNLETALKNIEKHYLDKHSTGFKKAETILINTGRAKDLNRLKAEYEAIGYYYDFFKEYLLVGPIIFVGADGYVTEGNLEIESRIEQSLGNILNKSISDMVLNGGIRIKTKDIYEFLEIMHNREEDYQSRSGEHWRFKDHKMVPYEPVPIDGYYEELEKVNKLFYDFLSSKNLSDGLKKVLSYDFTKYPFDLSQVDHQKK